MTYMTYTVQVFGVEVFLIYAEEHTGDLPFRIHNDDIVGNIY